jgi:rRNA maturation protein Nop10
MYDDIDYPCFFCGKENYAQTKILGNCTLITFKIKDKFFVNKNEGFYNCILTLKNECEKCGRKTAIVIKKGRFVGVENPRYANCKEMSFGNYEFDDELTQMMKEKLKMIEKDG